MDNKTRLEKRSVQSPETPGFYAVITPDNSQCRHTHVYRLNLPAGERYVLETGELEMHPVLIEGKARLLGNDAVSGEMERFDAFYLPGCDSVEIQAIEDCVFYIGGAVYERIGHAFFRKYESEQPIGDIRQIHGSGVSRREVFMTLSDKDDASRLICGLTWGGDGTWTSWPPHQHGLDLEEVYCYFDMPLPHFGFQISYLEAGGVTDIVTHTVYSGTMVQVPDGYHPTVASPGTRNAYFWVMGALRHSSRSYYLAKNDPIIKP